MPKYVIDVNSVDIHGGQKASLHIGITLKKWMVKLQM